MKIEDLYPRLEKKERLHLQNLIEEILKLDPRPEPYKQREKSEGEGLYAVRVGEYDIGFLSKDSAF
ncbi:MAG: hypothetical protein KDD22_07255, partial [Bdellovibrionales bacterium]|nr:hypothetical protein [Bdellovibrionales bacterium]